ncbi:MAG: hypothetical protein KAR01_00995 [Desulfocapsa sp.]|nr:hypothetical protein [Desulfocapsa sp.]
MGNSISSIAQDTPQALQRHNNKNILNLAEKALEKINTQEIESDTVEINSEPAEKQETYSSQGVAESQNVPDKYEVLRGLVTSMLKEQGIEFKVLDGEKEINISELSQEEAVELVAEDGYFGVDQTSQRIVDFAIAVAGGDPSRLDAIKEGVEDGFNEALKAFG